MKLKNEARIGKKKVKRKSCSSDSFYVDGDQIKVKDRRIWAPNLGWVRLKEALRSTEEIRSATFSRKADRWFVSVQVDTDILSKNQPNEAVSIDLGINSLAYRPDGLSTIAPKPLKKRQIT